MREGFLAQISSSSRHDLAGRTDKTKMRLGRTGNGEGLCVVVVGDEDFRLIGAPDIKAGPVSVTVASRGRMPVNTMVQVLRILALQVLDGS